MDSSVKLEKTLTLLSTKYEKKFINVNIDYELANSNNFQKFANLVRENYKLAHKNNSNNNTFIINELYTFCSNQHDFIKINKSRIPDGILPENKIGFITDINAIISNQKKRQLVNKENVKFYELDDDYIYKTYPEIQKNIPRGLTTFEIINTYSNNNNNNINDNKSQSNHHITEYHDFGIYANRKFIGLNERDDDDDGSHINIAQKNNNKYFIQDVKYTEKIIFMEKINGEAFHFSGRYIYNQFYWFIGSKRNHIMIGKMSDIDLYTDERYKQAKIFGKSFMKLLTLISKENLNILKDLLHFTKITTVCEILQPSYQHIVHIDGKDDKIIFLMFCSAFVKDSLTVFPPNIACEVMETLGFASANYEIYKMEDEEELSEMKEIRMKEDSEGVVLYHLNENDETIGLLKLKTTWYICLRALREKLSRYFNQKQVWEIDDLEKKINERYDQIQMWLSLTNEQVYEWKDIAKRFITWLNQQQNVLLISKGMDIKSKFPIFWKQFLSNVYFNYETLN